VRMLRVPYSVLFPAIIAFSAVGCYSLGLNAYDVLAVALFGVLGYFLIRMGCEPAPLLLGFVLGPLLEENLRRALIISRGDPSVFVSRPISLALLVLAAAPSSWQRSPRSAGSARSSSPRTRDTRATPGRFAVAAEQFSPLVVELRQIPVPAVASHRNSFKNGLGTMLILPARRSLTDKESTEPG
jgi:hypothetical protein